MQDLSGKLTVLHDDNGSYVDYSKQALDYGRDSFTVDFVALEDRLLIGYKKPINSLYFEFETAALADVGLSVKRYNGAWVALDDFVDSTNGFLRSAYWDWSRNQNADTTKENQTDEVEQTINGITGYFYEVTATSDFNVVLKGINFVFSDDQDLIGELPEIMRYKNSGETTFILRHQSARNYIIQKLRNRGNVKQKSNGKLLNVNQWDLLDRFELREASKFLVLSRIFFNIADDHESTEYQRHLKYEERFKDNFELYYMSLDFDDDGVTDSNERVASSYVQIERV